jgi:hypothetical protein
MLSSTASPRGTPINAELQAIGLDSDNIFKAAAYAVTCKNLKDQAEGMKTEVEGAEDSLGGAFLFDVKNGDALSKLARLETRIRNDIHNGRRRSPNQ